MYLESILLKYVAYLVN